MAKAAETATNTAASTNAPGITGINKPLIHPTWYVPMGYHVLTRVEHNIIGSQTVATFASYFSKAAYDNGGQYLDHTTVILPLQKESYPDLIKGIIADKNNELSDGQAV